MPRLNRGTLRHSRTRLRKGTPERRRFVTRCGRASVFINHLTNGTDEMRLTGKLINWNNDRGFGFIRNDGGGADLFAHISEFPRGFEPEQGQVVEFDTHFDQMKGKTRAVNVREIGT